MNGFFFAVSLLLLTSCSLYLEFPAECSSTAGCDGNLSCVDRLCVDLSCDATSDCPSGNSCRGDICAPLTTTDLLQAPCERVYGVTPEQALEPETLLLGTIFPKTGALKDHGPDMDRGVELAVSEINNVGGILGRRVGVVSCDSGTDVELAVVAGRRLFEEIRVPAIVGPGASGITIEVFNRVAKAAGGLVFSPSATSPAISGLDDDNLLWRTAPSDAIQGEAIARYLSSKHAQGKIAIISRTDAYGDGLRDAIVSSLCAPTGSFPCGDSGRYFSRSYADASLATDFSTILQGAGTNLSSFAPDVTVLIAFSSDGKKFLKQAEDQGVLRFIVSDGLKTGSLVLPDIAGGDPQLSEELLCNLLGTSPTATGGPALAQFETRFNSKYATAAPGVFSSTAYDAAYLLFFAIAAAAVENPTGRQIASALTRLSAGDRVSPGGTQFTAATQYLSAGLDRTINYDGASGALDLDASTGEAPASIGAWSLQVGETVKPITDLGVILSDSGTYTGPTFEGGIPGTSAVCDKYRVL